MNEKTNKVFLTAEWRNLAMLNYEVEPSMLAPFVPAGTELDSWNTRMFVSVVGFQFLRTKVFGLAIPCHRNFEEVNLRFYVRRKAGSEWRRGVVFIKEIVPRRAIAFVARKFYNEPYIFLPMGQRIANDAVNTKSVEYWWGAGRLNRLKVVTGTAARTLEENSEAEYITEHYWGYNAQRDGSALEYRVDHPRWRIHDISEASLECDVAGLYGERYCDVLKSRPTSAFLAEGSMVKVYRGAAIAL